MKLQTIYTENKTAFLLAAALLAALAVGVFISNQRLAQYTTVATLQVSEQANVLSTLAETIARNGADAVTESVIKDCPINDRIRFDALLGSLDSGLPIAELKALDQLFSSCASFYSDRKALMVVRFEREVAVYEDRVTLLDTLTAADEQEAAQVAQWRELLAIEQEQSELFGSLVDAQRQIITLLIEGKSATSDEIMLILAEVNEIREAQQFARQQAITIRSAVTSL